MENIFLEGDVENGFIIKLNDEIIGHLECTSTTIIDIYIEKKYRDNKYGTYVIEKYIDIVKSKNISKITTTAVTHKAMEKILDSNGFSEVPRVG